MNRQALLLALIAAGSCMLAGCASPQPVLVEHAPDEPWIESVLPPAPGGSITGENLYPTDPATLIYEVIDGDDSGADIPFARRETDQFGAHWRESEGDAQSEFLRRDENGAVVMTAAIDHGENALTLFEPPLVVGFPRMRVGEVLQSESKMRVVRADNPERQLESGTATRTIRYVDDVMINVGGKSYRAHRMEVRFTADLRFAWADKSAVRYCVPGLGVLVEERRQLVKVLGVTRKNTHQTIIATSVE